MRNIIITGGELFNKGAQAMTFITVDQLRRRFPNHRILLLSEQDKQRSKSEKQQYAFDFMGWYPTKFAKAQNNFLLRVMCLLRSREELLECEEIYKNSDLMVDISGYALGSNWGANYVGQYLEHLEWARTFGIPVYLMPQSFGPFDFKNPEIDHRCRELLSTVKVICAREQEGYDALVNTYGLTNVVRTTDLVLNNRGIDLSRVYRQMPEMHLPTLAEKSVGIIPNQRNFDVGDRDAVLAFYRIAIDKLLEYGNTVYILGHSDMDRTVCRELKGIYPQEERVVLLEQEFSCVEFDTLVRGFCYLVASRFHSIVHAYKNGIPCIALGWATKYHDLLAQFGQLNYLFDSRQSTTAEKVITVLEHMENQVVNESSIIRETLASVQKDNIFDMIEL